MFIKTGDLDTPRIVKQDELTKEQKKELEKKLKELEEKVKEFEEVE